MSRRGFHFPDRLIQELYDLTSDYHTERPSLNHVVKVMIQLGLPVFRQLRSQNPILARELMRRTYSYRKRQRASEKVAVIVEKLVEGMKIDDRLSVGLPKLHKLAFAREKRKRGIPMSVIARERMGIAP